jgi:hypothetical protein
MLAIHWTPVNKTKHILKEGITKSKNGVYCFPLTGHKILDKWWVNFFNQCTLRKKKSYNGIVFKISNKDFPAYFGHWIGSTTKEEFKKPIKSLNQLGKVFREEIIWRIGETISIANGITGYDSYKNYQKVGEETIAGNAKEFIKYYNDLDFMNYTLEDYQIVLSNSIVAKRIISVIPQGNEFGKVLRIQKLEKQNW